MVPCPAYPLSYLVPSHGERLGNYDLVLYDELARPSQPS